MNPALDNCPCCGTKLTVFYSMKAEELVAYCGFPKCYQTEGIRGTGDKTEDAKASFHGICLKRGLMKGKR